MHLGHASTYLLAWLQVRATGGQLLLRMEDVDRQRCKASFAEAWREDLRWLGLNWDREVAPQSTRGEAYQEALSKLQSAGLIFACRCRRKDMEEAVRAPHEAWGNYPGTCADKGFPFDGAVAMRLRYTAEALVLRRADGAWGYPLAVVVDDGDQGVTHVLRGQDLADSESSQAFLHQALGYASPSCLHAPLWLGPDTQRLSKRHGAMSLRSLREKGWSAEELLGQIAAALGYIPEPSPCHPEDLLTAYNTQPLRKEPVSHAEVLPLWA
jgi:glutamyl-tRNA synthetase